jgi:hypothetical protein
MTWEEVLKNESEPSGYDKMNTLHNDILSMLSEIEKMHMKRWERLNDPNRGEMYYVGANEGLEKDLEELDKFFVTFRGMS